MVDNRNDSHQFNVLSMAISDRIIVVRTCTPIPRVISRHWVLFILRVNSVNIGLPRVHSANLLEQGLRQALLGNRHCSQSGFADLKSREVRCDPC